MKTLMFAGLAGALALLPATANAASDSVVITPETASPLDLAFASPAAIAASAQGAKKMSGNMRGSNMGHRMGNNMGGMKMRGHQKMRNMGNMNRRHMNNGRNVRMGRMGYAKGYQRPHRGFQIPRTFIQPSYFIGGFSTYGLSQPSAGYGWSRYYDDAVLTDRRGVVYDTRYNLDWDRYNQGYSDGYQAGQATYDQGVFMNDTRVIATPSGAAPVGRVGGSSTYQGDWDGEYRPDGSYAGDWQGTVQDQDGRVYQGEYSGTFIGDANVTPHWSNGGETVYGGSTDQVYGGSTDQVYSPYGSTDQAYRGEYGREDYGREDNGREDYDRDYRDDSRSDELAYLAQCRKSSGIGGAVVGGAIGALAGNRIAGRGNRLGGSLIGGGAGALAGAAIEQGTDRCRKLLKKYGGRPEVARAPQYREPQYQAPQYQQRQAYPSGWQGGYYYPAYYYPQQQAPTVTTVVIQSQPVTTTTTTTYIDEEVTYSKARPVATKKLYKPAAKRVWKPAPQPILKGCQQAHC